MNCRPKRLCSESFSRASRFSRRDQETAGGAGRFGCFQRHRSFLFVGVSVPHGFAAHQWPSTLALIHRIPAPSVPPSPRTSARTIPHHHAVRQTPCHSEENDNPQRRHLDVLASLFTGNTYST